MFARFRDTGLSIDTTPEKSGGLVGNRGNDCVHEIAIKCPCVNMDGDGGLTGSSDPNCPRCEGRSYLYRDPARIVGLVTNMTANRFWSLVSWVQAGDLLFAPDPNARRIGDFDKITVLMPVPFDDVLLVRGVATSHSPRPEGLKENEDGLYWEAARYEAIWIEDNEGNSYKAGDYRLEGRKIVWVGRQPKQGVKYSVKYEAYPEYVAWTTPVDRWDRNRQLGQRVMLRRAVLALDSEFKKLKASLEQAISDNNPFRSESALNEYGALFDPKVNSRR